MGANEEYEEEEAQASWREEHTSRRKWKEAGLVGVGLV
jgi:hypothetical protein